MKVEFPSPPTGAEVERVQRLAHAIRWLALEALSFADSASVLHELQALQQLPGVSFVEYRQLLEQWHLQLMRQCRDNPSVWFDELVDRARENGIEGFP